MQRRVYAKKIKSKTLEVVEPMEWYCFVDTSYNYVSTSKDELKRYRKKSNDEENQDMGYAPTWSTTGNNKSEV